MTSCCSSTTDKSQKNLKHPCPGNNKSYATVSLNTILHHLKNPWQWQEKEQNYYFCDDPDCDVIYYGEDNTIIQQNRLRTPVGIKNQTPKAMICYCFGITYSELEKDPQLRQFVIDKTKNNHCACKILNPSGRCCLKEFSKI